ncbi:sulfatase-like hydrolase/transferase [Opitutia bacterium ISCC 51]|nr:sulfatase-like hydrolase/transferase [Opitutae bacterium ISCC 51]QXD30232.1 sulfatase-like hydrolase/transferase [Opitutae bacterium ISCC 52]
MPPFIPSLVLVILCTATALFAAERPNIVVILTDDQGYADISFNPNHPKEVNTPHMDSLAKEGVFFTQAYTSGVVCSPTRAGMMLGKYQQRVGIYTAGEGGNGFDPKLRMFPGFLPDEYTCTAIGKWHLGLDNDYPELKWHAMNRGFDEAYKFMGRGGHDYFESKGVNGDDYAPIYRNKTRIPADEYEGYLTTRLSEEAVAFIDREKDNPFFLYLAYNAVHTPAQAPQKDIDVYKKKYPYLSERRATLMAMLEHLDKGVGSVVNKLKDEGIWDNTLLFFLTDNGGAGAMEADNGILRGFKQQVYEGGIRTPWIVSWPKQFKGGRKIDTPVISFDILPTVMDALDLSPPEAKHFDGKSILPLIESKTKSHHDVLFWDTASPKAGWAVRKGHWKIRGDAKGLELYNLASDPSEAKDLAKKQPERVKAMEALYTAWRSEMAPPVSESQKRDRRNR